MKVNKFEVSENKISYSVSTDGSRYSEDLAGKNRKKAIIKLFAIAVSFVVLVIVGTISWFTMNREVENTGLQMTAVEGTSFELKTVGYYGYYDDRLPAEFQRMYTNQTTAGYPNTNNSGVLTTSDSASIQWLITSEYNTNNYVLSNSNDDDKGIRPGTNGEMKFWISSNGSPSVSISFTLSVKPYVTNYQLKEKENPSDPDEIYINPVTRQPVEIGVTSISGNSEYADVESYIRSHIIFFKERTPHYKIVDGQQVLDYYTFSEIIPVGDSFELVYDNDNHRYTRTLHFTFDNTANEYQDEPFSIYWVWPETLAEAVLPEIKQNSGKHAICTGNDILNRLIANPNLYMKGYTSDDIDGNTLNSDNIARYYSKLCLRYNDADQAIGDTIGYLLLELTATG